jgi:hypothetical protein
MVFDPSRQSIAAVLLSFLLAAATALKPSIENLLSRFARKQSEKK